MTFGKDLARLREEHPLFANHYIAYQELKDAVENGDVSVLMGLLRQELDRINDIVEVEMFALQGALQVRCRKAAESSPDAVDEESLENLAAAIVRLHTFVETSYQGFQKIMTRCSERQETASCSWFLARVEAAPFRHYSFDDLLVPLGQLYAVLRQQQPGPNDSLFRGLGLQALSPTGEGNSQVFFVSGKDVMRVKINILKNLRPAGAMIKAKTTQSDRDTSRIVSELSKSVVHVYLEGSSGNQYSERYKRRVGGFAAVAGSAGVLLRCRVAQGEDPTDPDQEVEVDIENEHCNATTFKLPQKAMGSLLSGAVDPKYRSASAGAVAEAIRRDDLRTAVSASFRRSSFTIEGKGGELEIASVDEHMLFRDEAALVDAKAWCSIASKTGTQTHWQVEFPGAILRLWLPGKGAEAFLRLAGIDAFGLKPAPGFSEALHGTALLHRELAVPLPPWIPSEDLMPVSKTSSLLKPRREPAPAEAKVDRGGKPKEGDKKKPVSKDMAAGGWCAALCGGASQDQQLLVDCKTPMSIERTLLRWLRSTMLLGGLSSFLVSSEDGSMQLNGVLLGCLAVMFTVLPTQSYWKRSVELQNPKSTQPKVDRFMPTMLAWSLSITLLATLVVSVCSETQAGAAAS